MSPYHPGSWQLTRHAITRNPYRLIDVAQGVFHNRTAVALTKQEAHGGAVLARAQ
jgi:hypothetical protein